ncbi:hypothetical protein ABZX98_06600 [Streptomyces sp. NPDC002992]|uniref:hypothetical protein n=1 Tax=Streptomyces sp. NPDC002992 TaxID=3154273 RepID=UPI0033BD3E38
MRSISLPKPVLLALLGCLVLSACGTQGAGSQRASVGSAGSAAATTPETSPNGTDPELRFLELLNRVAAPCAPDGPAGKGDAPRPQGLPGGEAAPTPRYGPGETPPGVPNADGDIPVPIPSDAPAPPTSAPDSTRPEPLDEMPLTGFETCNGSAHAQRIGAAFENTKTTTYQALHKTLTGLDYPAARIHRMLDQAGAPRVRIDLRMMGSRLALEVTGAGSGVVVEAFGAMETEDVNVADVKRKSTPKPKPKPKTEPDAPTS